MITTSANMPTKMKLSPAKTISLMYPSIQDEWNLKKGGNVGTRLVFCTVTAPHLTLPIVTLSCCIWSSAAILVPNHYVSLLSLKDCANCNGKSPLSSHFIIPKSLPVP